MATNSDINPGALAEALNNKVDTDVGNTNAIGNAVISNYAMPSSTFESMTLKASGSTYTAPADGWFTIRKNATAVGQYAGFRTSLNFVEEKYSPTNGGTISVIFPAAKGAIVECRYDAAGSLTTFGFVYAKGSEPQS